MADMRGDAERIAEAERVGRAVTMFHDKIPAYPLYPEYRADPNGYREAIRDRYGDVSSNLGRYRVYVDTVYIIGTVGPITPTTRHAAGPSTAAMSTAAEYQTLHAYVARDLLFPERNLERRERAAVRDAVTAASVRQEPCPCSGKRDHYPSEHLARWNVPTPPRPVDEYVDDADAATDEPVALASATDAERRVRELLDVIAAGAPQRRAMLELLLSGHDMTEIAAALGVSRTVPHKHLEAARAAAKRTG